MLKFFNHNIKEPLEKLKFAETLPAKESYMFLSHMKYEASSDYSEEDLAKPIGQLMNLEACGNCGGRGWYPVANGEDDIDHESCEFCEETGYLTPEITDDDVRDYEDWSLKQLKNNNK